MPYRDIYSFFRCYHCGEIYYSSRLIKTKKCLKCRKTFIFEKCKKKRFRITSEQAIKLLQLLKKKRMTDRNFDFLSFLNLFKNGL